MRGYGFSKFVPKQLPKGGFDELLKLFLELLNYTSGDAGEALAWMNELISNGITLPRTSMAWVTSSTS